LPRLHLPAIRANCSPLSKHPLEKSHRAERQQGDDDQRENQNAGLTLLHCEVPNPVPPVPDDVDDPVPDADELEVEDDPVPVDDPPLIPLLAALWLSSAIGKKTVWRYSRAFAGSDDMSYTVPPATSGSFGDTSQIVTSTAIGNTRSSCMSQISVTSSPLK
jgi:hypothetical protein